VTFETDDNYSIRFDTSLVVGRRVIGDGSFEQSGGDFL